MCAVVLRRKKGYDSIYPGFSYVQRQAQEGGKPCHQGGGWLGRSGSMHVGSGKQPPDQLVGDGAPRAAQVRIHTHQSFRTRAINCAARPVLARRQAHRCMVSVVRNLPSCRGGAAVRPANAATQSLCACTNASEQLMHLFLVLASAAAPHAAWHQAPGVPVSAWQRGADQLFPRRSIDLSHAAQRVPRPASLKRAAVWILTWLARASASHPLLLPATTDQEGPLP